MDNLHKFLLSTAIMHLEMAEKTLYQISDMYNNTAEYDVMTHGRARLQIQQARNTVEEIIKAGEKT